LTCLGARFSGQGVRKSLMRAYWTYLFNLFNTYNYRKTVKHETFCNLHR